MTSTSWPADPPASVRACRAVPAEIGTTAACSKERLAGLRASCPRGPRRTPRTSPEYPEHLVAQREPGHRRTDGADGAGEVEAGHRVLRPTEPEAEDAQQVRPTGHHVPGAPGRARRAYAHEHLVLGDLGRGSARLQDIRGAVPVLDDGPHHPSAGSVPVVALRLGFVMSLRCLVCRAGAWGGACGSCWGAGAVRMVVLAFEVAWSSPPQEGCTRPQIPVQCTIRAV